MRFAIRYSLVLILSVFIIGLAISNHNFLTVSNLNVILIQVSANALLATGATFVILTGGIDLSVGSIVGLAGVAGAMFGQNDGAWPCAEAIGAGLLAGLAVGAFNGALTAYARVPAFVATLGNMTVASGIAFVLSNGQPISGLSDQFMMLSGQVGFLAMPVLVMLVVVAVSWIVLGRTRFGMHVYAVGGNSYAARVAGINTARVKMLVYVISGGLAGMAGLLLAARATAGIATTGSGYELNAIAAAVIGGISLAGGRGSIAGTVMGFLMIGVLDNGLNIINVSPFYQEIVKGLIIIGAVFADSVSRAGEER
ncbi:ABC transporter permease [Ameyamaea chiangmaiensis]|uniref:ABC transporter permease n=1 Tax=Ameyamaea chiangmaiensis TaxID=442969 RepID=A0A850PG93_9PROT|nr:ABC transporter permease [Ameyamaea chiangmaiensis]MBS4075932.1 ABC transporter permease [Ameyamaea chiangmaiensis]NVN40181.1 ABC transporter permease [Ameyamaea chiangmaiensis]